MLEANLRGVIIEIPTSWNDVPFKNYIKFLDCDFTPKSVVMALTSINSNDYDRLTIADLGAINIALSFTTDLPNAFISDEDIKKIDIGFESYGKIELCKAKLIEVDKPFKALITICSTYLERDISEEPTSTIYPIGCFFLTKLISSLNVTNASMTISHRH
jgi:hypothetical protein